MNQLIIKLTGTIDSSNFDEWKKDLISQIHSVNKELITDDDFVTASRQVKSFNSAEHALKQAKQSAIDQADEIQRLFSAIDEVSEEARQARLSLDRQIKARKLEIKNQYIQSGIDDVQSFIEQQVDKFKHIDKSKFLDRSRFESATRGKAGTKGLQIAIDQLCSLVKKEVSDKTVELTNNKVKIEALPENYKLLFQDWKSLLGLSENELELEIDKRIARYNEEHSRREAVKKASALKKIEDLELNPERSTTEIEESNQKEKYRIIIDLLSTKDKAIDVARSIKEHYGSNPFVSEIKLNRNHDE